MRDAIQFLTRARCHLCEDARHELNSVCRRLGLDYEVIDIDAVPGYREFSDDIPVLLIAGRKVLKHRFPRQELERVLARPGRGGRSGEP